MVWMVTLLSIVVILGFASYQVFQFLESPGRNMSRLIIAIILMDIPVLCWLFSVSEYVLESDSLFIKRHIMPVRLKYDEIKSVSRLNSDYVKCSIRIFGNGGLFGFYGLFRNKNIGNYHAYFSNFSDLVLIETEKKKLAISPENSDFFIEYLKSRMNI